MARDGTLGTAYPDGGSGLQLNSEDLTAQVDVSKLKKSDVKGRDVTGGYILRIDTYNDDDATFASKVPGVGPGIMTSQITWSCIYPKKKNLQPEQMAYIQNYVDTMEAVIQGADFADPQKGYARYIDVPSFVDYFIHTELSLKRYGRKNSCRSCVGL